MYNPARRFFSPDIGDNRMPDATHEAGQFSGFDCEPFLGGAHRLTALKDTLTTHSHPILPESI